MTPRHRRLAADLAEMHELAAGEVVSFRSEGDPPDVYHLLISAPGIARNSRGAVVVRSLHRCTVYLHLDYPRRPPVVTWLTPVLHPNILGPERNGGVCIGAWSASERLADLVRRIVDLVTYRSFNVDDALAPDVAAWVRSLAIEPGVDLHRLATSITARHAG